MMSTGPLAHDQYNLYYRGIYGVFIEIKNVMLL